MGYKFDLAAALPSHSTWVRGEGYGIPIGASVTRLLTTAPIVVRTTLGGNTTGGLTMWVATLPATLF